MSTLATQAPPLVVHPVQVHVEPVIEDRNRLTRAFRLFLAIPHLLLVGGPIAAANKAACGRGFLPTRRLVPGRLRGGRGQGRAAYSPCWRLICSR
jgi:hypothetical protein